MEGLEDDLPLPLALAVRGYSGRALLDHVNRYCAVSPWVEGWKGVPTLVPCPSDAAVPICELEKTEFYNDGPREDALFTPDARGTLRLRAEAHHRAFARAVETLCRIGTGNGGDLVSRDGSTHWTLSLLPVAQDVSEAVLG